MKILENSRRENNRIFGACVLALVLPIGVFILGYNESVEIQFSSVSFSSLAVLLFWIAYAMFQIVRKLCSPWNGSIELKEGVVFHQYGRGRYFVSIPLIEIREIVFDESSTSVKIKGKSFSRITLKEKYFDQNEWMKLSEEFIPVLKSKFEQVGSLNGGNAAISSL